MAVPYFILLSLFFFYSYREHRVLHSFPTRRSSDLPLRLARSLGAPLRLPRLPLLPGHGREGHGSTYRAGDRKSTRLNSSHTVISYAVFCLKKKREFTQARLGGNHRHRASTGVHTPS